MSAAVSLSDALPDKLYRPSRDHWSYVGQECVSFATAVVALRELLMMPLFADNWEVVWIASYPDKAVV